MIDLYKLIFTLLATNSIINAYHAVQSPRSPSRLWETGLYTHPVKSMFVGDYSNLSQHTRDNKKGKTKGSDGGHEYVCASAVNHPSREDMLVFKYFYNNNSSDVFRYRLYQFFIRDKLLMMSLWKPKPQFEAQLQSQNYLTTDDQLKDVETNFIPLQGCDVIWTPKRFLPKFWHCGFKGRLENHEIILPSQRDPTRQIRVTDDLRLTPKELWINDRVYTHPEGDLIIGNINNVPYKLKRL